MKVNNILAIDYKLYDNQLLIYFKNTSTEQIAQLKSNLLTITTNSGEVVESFSGYKLKTIEYLVEENLYLGTYVQNLDTTTDDFLIAVNSSYENMKKTFSLAQTKIEELNEKVYNYSNFLTTFNLQSNQLNDKVQNINDQLPGLQLNIDILYEIFNEILLGLDTIEEQIKMLVNNNNNNSDIKDDSFNNYWLATEERFNLVFTSLNDINQQLALFNQQIQPLLPTVDMSWAMEKAEKEIANNIIIDVDQGE